MKKMLIITLVLLSVGLLQTPMVHASDDGEVVPPTVKPQPPTEELVGADAVDIEGQCFSSDKYVWRIQNRIYKSVEVFYRPLDAHEWKSVIVPSSEALLVETPLSDGNQVVFQVLEDEEVVSANMKTRCGAFENNKGIRK
ncbi:MAG: hypothetical protein ACRC5C_09630 [Bacilli bacterium]